MMRAGSFSISLFELNFDIARVFILLGRVTNPCFKLLSKFYSFSSAGVSVFGAWTVNFDRYPIKSTKLKGSY